MIPCLRSAVLDGYVELAESLGLDPARQVAAAGLSLAELRRPERWIPAAAAAWLLETSARASGAEDVGLRLAERRRLASLGPLSVVLREEPDLRSALRLLVRHERSLNEAVSLRLTEDARVATLRLDLTVGEPAPVRQARELGVAAVHGLIRELRGPGWHPLAVCFVHPAPVRSASHERVFGPRLRFEAGFTGLVLRASDLAAENVLADPLMRPYRARLLRVLPPPPARTLAGQVRDLVETLLPVGHASMRRVAGSLGVPPRTLRRRLDAEGAVYTSIVDDVRTALAERYLADDRLSLTDITHQLGFAAPSAFARWFRRRFGTSPSAWREAARAPGPAVRPSGERTGTARAVPALS